MRLRVVLVGMLVVALFVAGRAPAARADYVPGFTTPGCVTGWTAWAGGIGGVGALEISFRLWLSTTGGTIEGAWESGSGSRRGAQTWYGASGAGGNWMVSGSQTHVLVPWEPGQGTTRFGLRMLSGAGCFTVTNVVVTRVPWVGQGTPPPGPTLPAETNTPYPTHSAGATNPPGYCWVESSGGWVLASCATPAPTPTPGPIQDGPGCEGQSYTGYGTFVYYFGPSAGPCLLWSGYVTASGTLTATLHGGSEGYRTGTAVTIWRTVQAGAYSVGRLSPVGTTCPGSSCVAVWAKSGTGSNQWSEIAASDDAKNYSAGAASWVAFWVASSITSNTGLHGAITVSGPSLQLPDPTPTPNYPAEWCTGDGAGTLFCMTPPPGWFSPPPIPPNNDGSYDYVEVCGPSSIASDRLLCTEVVDQSDVGEPGPGGESQIGEAFGDLQEQMSEHAPFSWAGEVAAALSPAGYAGADIDWCFTALDAEICVNPYAVTNPIAGFRPVFLGLLLVMLAWAVARRVWAVVGGTPGTDA